MMSEVVYGLIHAANGRYGISFPDFPGCVAAGATPDEALRRGAETLRFHIAGMIDDGETFPRLRGLSELQRSKAFKSDAKDAAVVGVNVELPGKAVRVNISLEERLLEAIDRAATHAGQSRSAFLAEAAQRRIKSAA
jgi:predicted RNase H-like HicB family nuclease